MAVTLALTSYFLRYIIFFLHITVTHNNDSAIYVLKVSFKFTLHCNGFTTLLFLYLIHTET